MIKKLVFPCSYRFCPQTRRKCYIMEKSQTITYHTILNGFRVSCSITGLLRVEMDKHFIGRLCNNCKAALLQNLNCFGILSYELQLNNYKHGLDVKSYWGGVLDTFPQLTKKYYLTLKTYFEIYFTFVLIS